MSLSFGSCHILGSEKMHNETIMTNLSDFQQIKNQTVASKTESDSFFTGSVSKL